MKEKQDAVTRVAKSCPKTPPDRVKAKEPESDMQDQDAML